ncbi:16S rRNA (guanine(527)-N(7))-methyltransferase RsmG [Rhodocyclus tenuis]|uniref:Ribosomal RNA small subunit methyltransferase G n=1 Tax=Rhodocyclus tenuis TaxID=1066 RepID=A0A840G3F4_RHOTE|nr:16S rRNA (guanine(527)-N(7))-methyltransferase RsmG [Rhodocyclus tenuis]MBB4248924.1 16S rRNA (guanine527-N7)-methyltransferase [Rhodocyclus tenuis]
MPKARQTPAEQLAQGLVALGIELAPAAQQTLLAYAALLDKWNRAFNLTALRDPEKAVSHHLLDSLAILPHLLGATLLDVGSGGGLPGIPLAIARPGLAVTLLDSNSKKTAFLRQAAIELGLANVSVHCGRIEDFRPAQPFAAIVSRAFAELADFVRPTRALLAPDGGWLAMKGLIPHEEIARLPEGVVVSSVTPLAVPGVDGERHLLLLKDTGATRPEGV